MKRLAREVWRQTWRAFVAMAGGGLVLAGIAMLVLPGPGILASPLASHCSPSSSRPRATCATASPAG